MNLHEWADVTVEKLRAVQTAARGVSAALPAARPAASPAQPTALDPRAVLEALATGLLADNYLTQQVAIRAANLSSKYPKRAA